MTAERDDVREAMVAWFMRNVVMGDARPLDPELIAFCERSTDALLASDVVAKVKADARAEALAPVDAILAETPHQPSSLMQASFRLNRIRRAIRPEGDMYAHGVDHSAPSVHDLEAARERGRAEGAREVTERVEAVLRHWGLDFDGFVGYRAVATDIRAALAAVEETS